MKLFLALALTIGVECVRGQTPASPAGVTQAEPQDAPIDVPDPRMNKLPGNLAGDFSGIGRRGGRPVDLRFYGGFTGVFDNQLQPFSTDANGNLVRVGDLYGISASIGAYGTHVGKRYGLEMDYRGLFNHYFNDSHYDGSDHAVVLGYRYQFSRRWQIDLSETAGTYSFGTGAAADLIATDPQAAPQLFDNRMNYLHSGASVNWIASSRMSYQVSASGFYQAYQNAALGKSHGYTLNGSLSRRLSRNTSGGFSYGFSQFRYPASNSEATTHSFQLTLSTKIPGKWTFSLQAGASNSETTSPILIPLSPALAALLGTSSLPAIAYTKTWYPSGSADLKRAFRRSELHVGYGRSVSSGDGFFYTSRRESGTVSYSFSGTRKMSYGLDGGVFSSSALNVSGQRYTYYTAGAGFTYHLYRSVNWTGRFDYRRQDQTTLGLRNDGSRVTLGLAFSSNSLPLALW